SSTTRIRPLAAPLVATGWGAVISRGGYRLHCRLICRVGHGERKIHAEGGAAPAPVGNFDGTAMLLDDAVAHRKAETGAFARGLGGEERIVDAMQVLGRNALSGVGDFDSGAHSLGPRTDLQRP